MLAILLCAFLVIRLIDDIKSRDLLKVLVAAVGLVLALLVCLQVIPVPECFR